MRAVVAGLGLMALVACGGDSSTARSSDSVVGSWSLQTYNGQKLPFTGSPNENGSINRVDSGTIAFDANHNYVIGIKIVNTLGTRVAQQDFNPDQQGQTANSTGESSAGARPSFAGRLLGFVGLVLAVMLLRGKQNQGTTA